MSPPPPTPINLDYIFRLRAPINKVSNLGRAAVTFSSYYVLATSNDFLFNDSANGRGFHWSNVTNNITWTNSPIIGENVDFTFSVWIGGASGVNYSYGDINLNITNHTLLYTTNPTTRISLYNITAAKPIIVTLGSQQASFPDLVRPSNGPIHFALVRKDNIVHAALNGKFSSYTMNYSGQVLGTGTKYIGLDPSYQSNNISYLTYYVADFCLINGVALWTQNFTRPSTFLPNSIIL